MSAPEATRQEWIRGYPEVEPKAFGFRVTNPESQNSPLEEIVRLFRLDQGQEHDFSERFNTYVKRLKTGGAFHLKSSGGNRVIDRDLSPLIEDIKKVLEDPRVPSYPWEERYASSLRRNGFTEVVVRRLKDEHGTFGASDALKVAVNGLPIQNPILIFSRRLLELSQFSSGDIQAPSMDKQRFDQMLQAIGSAALESLPENKRLMSPRDMGKAIFASAMREVKAEEEMRTKLRERRGTNLAQDDELIERWGLPMWQLQRGPILLSFNTDEEKERIRAELDLLENAGYHFWRNVNDEAKTIALRSIPETTS